MSRGKRAAPAGRRRSNVRPVTGPSTGSRRPAMERNAAPTPLGFPMAGTAGSRSYQRTERRRNRLVGLVTLLLVGSLVGASIYGVMWLLGVGAGRAPDFAGPGHGEVLLKISEGSSLTAIGAKLQQNGVVASQRAFLAAASENPNSAGIRHGWYRLREQMSGRQAVEAMLDPRYRGEIKVTLPEGLRLKAALSRLSKATGIPERDFKKALKKDIGLPAYADGKAEGFLFPMTYEIEPDATAQEVLRTITAQFAKVAEVIDLADARPGFTPRQIVTIASLIEAEARGQTEEEKLKGAVPPDYGKVAQVIYNRLEINRQLQFDSTVNYALDDSKRVVTLKDLKVKSPYNTYANKGLPPGPINSPSEAAMRAALAPTPGPWIYFVTTNLRTGETKFVETEQEFFKIKAELKAYLKDNPGTPTPPDS